MTLEAQFFESVCDSLESIFIILFILTVLVGLRKE